MQLYKLNSSKSKCLTRNKFFNCQELLFLFLKGMAGALAPFNYLVQRYWQCENVHMPLNNLESRGDR